MFKKNIIKDTMNRKPNREPNHEQNHEQNHDSWTINQGLTLSTIRSSSNLFSKVNSFIRLLPHSEHPDTRKISGTFQRLTRVYRIYGKSMLNLFSAWKTGAGGEGLDTKSVSEVMQKQHKLLLWPHFYLSYRLSPSLCPHSRQKTQCQGKWKMPEKHSAYCWAFRIFIN